MLLFYSFFIRDIFSAFKYNIVCKHMSYQKAKIQKYLHLVRSRKEPLNEGIFFFARNHNSNNPLCSIFFMEGSSMCFFLFLHYEEVMDRPYEVS
jgi:hypothetical protein